MTIDEFVSLYAQWCEDMAEAKIKDSPEGFGRRLGWVLATRGVLRWEAP